MNYRVHPSDRRCCRIRSVTNCARQRQAKQEQAKPTAHCDSSKPMRSSTNLKNRPAKFNTLQYVELGGLYKFLKIEVYEMFSMLQSFCLLRNILAKLK